MTEEIRKYLNEKVAEFEKYILEKIRKTQNDLLKHHGVGILKGFILATALWVSLFGVLYFEVKSTNDAFIESVNTSLNGIVRFIEENCQR